MAGFVDLHCHWIPGVDDGAATLDDAVALHEALPATHHAVVLGAGLIGMHAAENLAKAGAKVTIVEMQPQCCRGTDVEAAVPPNRPCFAGVRPHGTQATRHRGAGRRIASERRGDRVHLLVVGSGAPVTDFLAVKRQPDRALVDDTMRSSVLTLSWGDAPGARVWRRRNA
jgi:phenylglyoxylate dehydrogenase epsilon subunit